jgi:putative ABC transport system permease protein
MPSEFSEFTHAERMTLLGEVDFESPSSINIYADTFEDKEKLSSLIAKYNEGVADEDKISYTDIVALAMSGISTIINVISYVLIAFVSISLVVSSIMIGIITYISVLERTKEIGILRAIGASKGDISRVFNAETLIVGFVSGFIGIVMTMLICIPANAIIQNLTGIASLEAVLEPIPAVVLVFISMLLTFFAGLVPAKIAAKKDPVVALRSE